VLQCVAVCCSVLQCVAVCCSVLRLQHSCRRDAGKNTTYSSLEKKIAFYIRVPKWSVSMLTLRFCDLENPMHTLTYTYIFHIWAVFLPHLFSRSTHSRHNMICSHFFFLSPSPLSPRLLHSVDLRVHPIWHVRHAAPASHPRHYIVFASDASHVRLLHHIRVTTSYLRLMHHICMYCITFASLTSHSRLLHHMCVYCITFASTASHLHLVHHNCVWCKTFASVAWHLRLRHHICVWCMAFACTVSNSRLMHHICDCCITFAPLFECIYEWKIYAFE